MTFVGAAQASATRVGVPSRKAEPPQPPTVSYEIGP